MLSYFTERWIIIKKKSEVEYCCFKYFLDGYLLTRENRAIDKTVCMLSSIVYKRMREKAISGCI